MNKFFNIGDRLYGYCNGYFGRDDYDEKICILVTSKYAIFQYINGEWEGNAVALNYPNRLSESDVEKWKEDSYEE